MNLVKQLLGKLNGGKAWERLEQDDGHILVDVRSREEYGKGHIPGAICIPNDSLTQPPQALPDPDQVILLYCLTGRRSREAARKLKEMGYGHVSSLGGIAAWQGEVVKGEKPG